MTTADTPLVLGFDIGGTNCAAAVADGTEKMLTYSRWPSEVDKGPQAMIRRMTDEGRKILAKVPGKLVGIGIGCGGPLDRHSGIVLGPPNLPGWDRVSLTARLAAMFNVPAWLENDANVGAMGEYRYGAGQGAGAMVYVTLSTGIGAGILFNGEVFYGAGDASGELGHQTILPDGPKCNCGNSGCLEVLASGTAIASRARAAILAQPAEGRALVLLAGDDPQAITARHVAETARAGDPFSRKLWAETIGYLGIGLGNMITLLAPQRVVLGGGLTAAGDLLFDPLREVLRQRVRLVPMDQVDVVPAGLGADSVLRGSLALALQSVEDKRPMAPRAKVGRRTTGDLRKVR